MVFVKVVKNKAYFKRFQVKYRRRREGKTDYRARRTMVLQDKTKYNQPKYRMVVRISNKDIVTQIVHSKITGDEVLMAAYSHELPAFGVKVGLTNYAAAYCTGLLLARRTLTKLGVAKEFPGAKEATGAFKAVRTKKDDEGEEEGRFPFKAILDVGLARTTTGARLFGAMKGAVDGGIAVPHKASRFPGYNKEKGELNAKVHRDRIFGAHVASYMKNIATQKQGNPDEKISQFDRFAKNKINPGDLEAMYKKAHEEIRKDPTKRLPKKAAKAGGQRKAFNIKKLTRKERQDAVAKKVAAIRKSSGKK
jgi:large subunit ribosomal protein L5e